MTSIENEPICLPVDFTFFQTGSGRIVSMNTGLEEGYCIMAIKLMEGEDEED